MRLLKLIYENGTTRQCDARCYNAGEKHCKNCPCQGMNHGIGKEKAIVQTREHWQSWVTQEGVESYTLSPDVKFTQLSFHSCKNKERGVKFISNHLDDWSTKIVDRQGVEIAQGKEHTPQESYYIQTRLWK